MAAKRRRNGLGSLETRVMKAVWRRGRATVREVLEALPGRRRLAYTTVLTTLRNLERKGFLRHDVEGRSHVYLPVIEERTVARTALGDLMERLFDGSRAQLVNALFDEGELSRHEFEQLRREILELRRKEQGEGEGR